MGYVYHYDFSFEGKPFVIMQLGDVNLDKFRLESYYQAMNYVNRHIIDEKMVKGHIERWDYILDLNGKFLSLPVTALKDIVSKIG